MALLDACCRRPVFLFQISDYHPGFRISIRFMQIRMRIRLQGLIFKGEKSTQKMCALFKKHFFNYGNNLKTLPKS